MSDPRFKARLLSETSTIDVYRQMLIPLLWSVFPLGDNPHYEPPREQSVAGMAAAQRVDPAELMYDLLVADGGSEFFYQPLGLYEGYCFDYFERAIADDNVIFGLSDGGAHCGVIADAGMPTFVLTHWGRDRTRGYRFPVEHLVKGLTHDTAHAYGLRDRGTLEPGMVADINLIDYPNLRLYRPEATYDLPANGRRLVQRVDGYEKVIKSGEVIVDNNVDTGARPGHLLRGGRRDRRQDQPHRPASLTLRPVRAH